MKVLFLTTGPDIVASSRARVYQYLTYLHKENIKAKVIPFTSRTQAYKIINNIKRSPLDEICGKVYSCLNILRFLFLCRRFDILFIQKIILPSGLVNIIKKINNNMVFDFDDAIFLTDRYEHNNNDKFLKRFNYILRNCKCVIAGNNFLKEKAVILNKKVYALPTPVDTARFPAEREGREVKNNIVIGWIGSPDSCGYLRGLRHVFEILARGYGNLEFEFIGADDFYKGQDKFTIKEWSFDREAGDLQNLDIGIMPLSDSEYARAKCGYKLLQYMSMGIPAVASPIGINCELIQDGVNGFLAGSQEEWKEKLDLLLKNSDLRLKIGRAGRKTVEQFYSYEIIAPKLIGVFKDLSNSKKGS